MATDNKTTAPKTAAPTAAPTAVAVPPKPTKAVATVTEDAVLAALGCTSPEGGAPAEKKFITLPYVGFRGIKTTKRVDELNAAGIEANDFYLCESGEFLRVKPMELHLLQYIRLYTQQDEEGEITGVAFQNSDDLFDQKYREHLFCVVAVFQKSNDGKFKFTPATLALRSGQTKALKQAINLLDGPAQSAEAWGGRSANHAIGAKAAVPGGRFRTRIWSTSEKPAVGKQNYNEGHGSTVMPKAEEIDAFNQWLKDDYTRIAAVIGLNAKRVEEAKKAGQAS